VIIVVQEGLSEGSHVIDITSVSTTSMRTIPQANGSVAMCIIGVFAMVSVLAKRYFQKGTTSTI